MGLPTGYPAARERPELAGRWGPTPGASAPAWARYLGSHSLVAAAGEFGSFQLLNPGDEELDVIIEMVVVASGNTSPFTIRRSRTPLATRVRGWARLGAGGAEGRAEVRVTSGAEPEGTIVMQGRAIANDLANQLPFGLSLAPGESLIYTSLTAAATTSVTFIGSERPRRP